MTQAQTPSSAAIASTITATILDNVNGVRAMISVGDTQIGEATLYPRAADGQLDTVGECITHWADDALAGYVMDVADRADRADRISEIVAAVRHTQVRVIRRRSAPRRAPVCVTTGLPHADSEGLEEEALEVSAKIIVGDSQDPIGEVHRVGVHIIRDGCSIGWIEEYPLRGRVNELLDLDDLSSWMDDALLAALAALCCDIMRTRMIHKIRGAIADAWAEICDAGGGDGYAYDDDDDDVVGA